MNFLQRWWIPASESKLERPEHTKDLCELEKFGKQVVFDPSPIGNVSLGFAFTHERTGLWEHWDALNRRYPLVLSIKTQPKHRVRGIVSILSTEELKKLDSERKNGLLFHRRMIPIELPSPNTQQPNVVEVWGYKANPAFWRDDINFQINYYRQERGCAFKRGRLIWDGQYHKPMSYYVYTDSISRPTYHGRIKSKDEPRPNESS